MVSFQQWPSVKPTMPDGFLPCLEFDDGKRMGDTRKIMKFLA